MDADDVLLGDRRDVGHLLLDVAQQRMRDVAVAVRDDHQHGADRQRDERELPREDEDDDADADDREDVLEEEDQAVAEEEPDALQVDRRAAHQLAGLVAVVVAEREPHELRVDRRPHVHLDVQRLLARDQPAAGHHDRAQDAEPEHGADQQRQPAQVIVVEDADDAARQQHGDERRDLRPDREHDRDAGRPLVRAQKAQQAHEGRAVARRRRLGGHDSEGTAGRSPDVS